MESPLLRHVVATTKQALNMKPPSPVKTEELAVRKDESTKGESEVKSEDVKPAATWY